MPHQRIDSSKPKLIPSPYPAVVIIGRPNVGKSTLFNRLIGYRKAIVHDVGGTTRDVIHQVVPWKGREFLLIDTGGMQFAKPKTLEASVEFQAQRVVKESELLLWIVDLKEGPAPLDDELAEFIRRLGKKTLVIANKADNPKRLDEISFFYRWGFRDIFPVSALHGHGSGDLLDAIVDRLPQANSGTEGEKLLFKITIAGEPNSGKSTYLNRILKKDRVVVAEWPGTTRDVIEEKLKWKGYWIGLMDTAGLRARAKVKDSVGFFSLARTQEALRRTDIVLLFFDAATGFSKNSRSFVRLVSDYGKGCILVANKWDLVRSNPHLYETKLKKMIPFLGFLKMEFISALRGDGILKPIESAFELWQNYQKRIATKELNDFLKAVTSEKPPPPTVRFKFMVQTGVKPPSFQLFVKNKQRLNESYFSYLRNQLVRSFHFEGIPIEIRLKEVMGGRRRIPS